MACDCPDVLNNSGNSINAENHIPIRSGAPMSTLNQRNSIMGSIPQVVRYAGFSLVDCGVVVNKPSNGGIQNPSLFFKNQNCGGSIYANQNTQLPVNCCG